MKYCHLVTIFGEVSWIGFSFAQQTACLHQGYNYVIIWIIIEQFHQCHFYFVIKEN